MVLNFIMLSVPDSAQAASKEVQITTQNYDEGKAIQEALDLQKGDSPAYSMLTITIQPGTYWIKESFLVYSNTKISAKNGAKIYYTRDTAGEKPNGRAPIISNYCEGKKGYTGASNITIEGGVWDFQGHRGATHFGITMEAFRFAHGQNIVIQNLTIQNFYRSHMVTLEGVRHVQVKNCVFKNYTNRVERKEAIHIDCMHNSAMAPSNQDNVIYDDTICHNITVTKCTFQGVPRGVGTHIAVAGLYPSNIAITNNYFTDITYEAIKAYHYKNVQITGNIITRAGEGIKCYLYSADSDRDEEGNSNYLPPLPGVKTETVPPNLNVRIQNNWIRDIRDVKAGYGIRLVGIAGRVLSGVNVSYNRIYNIGQTVSTRKSGIYMKRVNAVRVVANRVYNTGGGGITFVNSTNIVVRDNDVRNPLGNGIATQYCIGATYYKNWIYNPGKCGVYVQATTSAKLSYNTVTKDKRGSFRVVQNSNWIQLIANTSSMSGRNAFSVSVSPKTVLRSNIINKPGRYGIYVTKSDLSSIYKNTVNNSKSTAIIASTSSGIIVDKNKITKTGKYGILFTSAKKCYAKRNTIEGTKRLAIVFSKNSKNKKQNLNISHIRAKRGAKEIVGYAYKGMNVRVMIGKKRKYAKTKANGTFTVKVKKLKKKTTITVRLTDKKKNIFTKTVKVK